MVKGKRDIQGCRADKEGLGKEEERRREADRSWANLKGFVRGRLPPGDRPRPAIYVQSLSLSLRSLN